MSGAVDFVEENPLLVAGLALGGFGLAGMGPMASLGTGATAEGLGFMTGPEALTAGLGGAETQAGMLAAQNAGFGPIADTQAGMLADQFSGITPAPYSAAAAGIANPGAGTTMAMGPVSGAIDWANSAMEYAPYLGMLGGGGEQPQTVSGGGAMPIPQGQAVPFMSMAPSSAGYQPAPTSGIMEKILYG